MTPRLGGDTRGDDGTGENGESAARGGVPETGSLCETTPSNRFYTDSRTVSSVMVAMNCRRNS